MRAVVETVAGFGEAKCLVKAKVNAMYNLHRIF